MGERDRRKAEQDWKATQTENERTQRSVECQRRLDGLQQLRRDSAEYKAQYDDYRKDCSGVQDAPTPKRSRGGTSSGPTRKDRKPEDMDSIMKNATDGTVF
jgi:hypothetical protein